MLEVPGQEPGLTALRQAISQRWPNASQVPNDELAKRFPNRSLLAGWRIPDLLSGEPYDLLVAVDQEFPWSLPLLALPEATNAISYPHVEVDGHLCLTPTGSAFALPVGIEHVAQLLDDACDALAQGATGENDDDFFSEAQSYWSLAQRSSGSIWLVSPPPAEHSIWVSALVADSFVIGPDKQTLQDWAAAGAWRLMGGFEPALVVKLHSPLHPKDYPLTMKELTSFIDQRGAGPQLKAVVAKWHARRALPVVLVFEHGGKAVCLGGAFLAPRQVRLPGSRHNGIRGFRSHAKGRSGARLVALGTVPARFPHLKVTPVYRSFLHERTAGASAASLSACHAIVAGCGAIGGQLAVQLAQAGVGRLTLLDGEALTWQNVGRHVVDSSAVGQPKAKALEHAIRLRFPDAHVEGIPKTWQAYRRDGAAAFRQADLVIAATGDAAGNLHLDALSADGEAPATIFTWLEPFGVAAHALFRMPGDRGLRDVTDKMGRLKEPVSDLASAPPLPREPACGAFYQPYSSLSALPTVALAGQLALDALNGRVSRSVHRVWVGGADEFGDNGLSLHTAWLTRLNTHGYHRRFEFTI